MDGQFGLDLEPADTAGNDFTKRREKDAVPAEHVGDRAAEQGGDHAR